MPIARLPGQSVVAASATTSVVGTYPTPPSIGDLLVAIVRVGGIGTTPSVADALAGWTQMTWNQEGAAVRSVGIFAKIAVASQPVNVTASRASATAMHINLSAYSGASPSLTGATTTNENTVSGSSYPCGVLGITDPGSLIIGAMSASSTLAAPGESTAATFGQQNPGVVDTGLLIDAWYFPGSLGSYAITFTSSNARTYSAVMAEFLPAAAVPAGEQSFDPLRAERFSAPRMMF